MSRHYTASPAGEERYRKLDRDRLDASCLELPEIGLAVAHHEAVFHQALGGDLEGGVGAGAGLVEEHEHGLALEGGDFFHRAGEEIFERGGLIEQMLDFLAAAPGRD